jgi:hypothetical protein
MLPTSNNMSDASHATARQGHRGQGETRFEEVEHWSRYPITRSAREQHRRRCTVTSKRSTGKTFAADEAAAITEPAQIGEHLVDAARALVSFLALDDDQRMVAAQIRSAPLRTWSSAPSTS